MNRRAKLLVLGACRCRKLKTEVLQQKVHLRLVQTFETRVLLMLQDCLGRRGLQLQAALVRPCRLHWGQNLEASHHDVIQGKQESPSEASNFKIECQVPAVRARLQRPKQDSPRIGSEDEMWLLLPLEHCMFGDDPRHPSLFGITPLGAPAFLVQVHQQGQATEQPLLSFWSEGRPCARLRHWRKELKVLLFRSGFLSGPFMRSAQVFQVEICRHTIVCLRLYLSPLVLFQDLMLADTVPSFAQGQGFGVVAPVFVLPLKFVGIFNQLGI